MNFGALALYTSTGPTAKVRVDAVPYISRSDELLSGTNTRMRKLMNCIEYSLSPGRCLLVEVSQYSGCAELARGTASTVRVVVGEDWREQICGSVAWLWAVAIKFSSGGWPVRRAFVSMRDKASATTSCPEYIWYLWWSEQWNPVDMLGEVSGDLTEYSRHVLKVCDQLVHETIDLPRSDGNVLLLDTQQVALNQTCYISSQLVTSSWKRTR